MSLPVFFPPPEISLSLPAGEKITLSRLCELAEVACQVSGISAEREIFVAASPKMRIVRRPGALSAVWLGIPPGTGKRRSLLALGMLAYGEHDYGARETLRGLPESRASVGPGRPRSRRPLTGAERQQRHRRGKNTGLSAEFYKEKYATKEWNFSGKT